MLSTEHNIRAVVSCNEEFEPVVTLSEEEWRGKGVALFKVNVADFDFAPSTKQLDEAAEFMHQYISGRGEGWL